MQPDDCDRWRDAYEAFHARLAPLFDRSETRTHAAKYPHGLLAPGERKNGGQMAEAIGDATPDRLQRLLYRVDGDADAARDILQIESFGHPTGMGVLDETGFLKKGTPSVGVQRQDSGTVGKSENCQIGVFLTDSTPAGHVFWDRQRYLPESWCADPDRRAAAQVSPQVVFETKPAQGIARLEHAWARGVPMRWVTGDEVYGDDPRLRAAVAGHGRGYVLAVSSITPVWTKRPAVVAPGQAPRGRPRTNARLAPAAPHATTVAAVVATWPDTRWRRFRVAEGEKGPRLYDWGRVRVIESRDHLPGPEVWLLARRSVSDPREIADDLALAPWESTLRELAVVAATRDTVEQCLEEAKGETGLDQYEVRFWPSWYRHSTLALLAHAWLATIRSTEAARKGTYWPSWRR